MHPFICAIVTTLLFSLGPCRGVRNELEDSFSTAIEADEETTSGPRGAGGRGGKGRGNRNGANAEGQLKGRSKAQAQADAWRSVSECQATLRRALEGIGQRGQVNPCKWRGVFCESGCVAKIEILDAKGRLEALSNLTGLTFLRLESPEKQLKGHLGALSNMKVLRTLDLENLPITGSVDALAELKVLEHVYLKGTQLTGDLRALSGHRQLSVLGLSETKLTGQLNALSQLPRLQRLYLSESQVTGELEDLRALKQLRTLDLSQTRVAGELDALGQMPYLKHLRLSGLQVSGDLKAFVSLNRFEYLEELDLSRTQVAGDFEALWLLEALRKVSLAHSRVSGTVQVNGFSELQQLDLSGTAVTGWVASMDECCPKLLEINLAGSHISIILNDDEDTAGSNNLFSEERLLPKLHKLDVSNTSLNATVAQLLHSLATVSITTLIANNCNLHGAIPRLDTIGASGKNLGFKRMVISQTLQTLELSGNNVTDLRFLPAHLRMDLSRNLGPVSISPSALTKAAQKHVDFDLTYTELANVEEVQSLLTAELPLLPVRSFVSETGGYVCSGFAAPTLHVTPDRFMPMEMCVCRAGYFGTGTSCKPCPEDTYSDSDGQEVCQACPPHSHAPAAASSLESCDCDFGKPNLQNGRRQCVCGKHTALSDGACAPCSKLHLQCHGTGHIAEEAFPESGYARLARAGVFRCLHASRCPGATVCAAGYSGPLCVDCAPGYRSTGNACAECLDLHGESTSFVSFALLGVLCLAGAAALAYACRGRFPSPGLTSQCAGRLFVTQAPVLLQLAQLWSVMGHLGVLRDHDKDQVLEAQDANATTTSAGDSDPLLSYVEVLQLTGSELISFVDLQCRADGPSVRAFLSLATPLFPLGVLAVCAALELGSRGTGVSAALKALTLLFVGGASGAVQLLSCQEYDGEGRQIPEDFAFRPLFPSLRCADHDGLAAWVDAVGWSSGVVYAIVVPVFLGVLFAKQSVCTQQTKTVLLVSDDKMAEHVQLEVKRANKSEHVEEEVLVKRNVAAAAAFIAAGFRGRATVQLIEDKVIVIPVQRSSEMDSEITAENLFVQSNTSQADAVRRNVMMQMLIERSILEEIKSDRMMIGARQLLSKYASGSYVWMEGIMKLASAVLVAVVTVRNGFWLSLGVNVLMALIVGVARPFAQPQVNSLQSFCFTCLALAAMGFASHDRLLPRVALAGPVLLLAAQLLRPDSAEALALRLQQDLEKQLPALQRGESVEVHAEGLRFL